MLTVARALAAAALFGMATPADAFCGKSQRCGIPPNATEELCCDARGVMCLNKAEHLCGPPPTTCQGWFDIDEKVKAKKRPCNINASTGAPVDLVCGPLVPKERGLSAVNGVYNYYTTVCTAVGFTCKGMAPPLSLNPKLSYPWDAACPATTQVATTAPPNASTSATVELATTPNNATAPSNASTSATGAAEGPQVTITSCYFTGPTCAAKATSADTIAAASCSIGARQAGTACTGMCFDKVVTMDTVADYYNTSATASATVSASSYCDMLAASGSGCTSDANQTIFVTRACAASASADGGNNTNSGAPAGADGGNNTNGGAPAGNSATGASTPTNPSTSTATTQDELDSSAHGLSSAVAAAFLAMAAAVAL